MGRPTTATSSCQRGSTACYGVQFTLFLTILCSLYIHQNRLAIGALYSANSNRDHFLNSLKPFSAHSSADTPLSTSEDTHLSASENDALRYLTSDYLSFHKANRVRGKRLVFTPHVTGMGDRFTVLLFAYWSAVVSRRVFLLHWHDTSPLQEFLVEADGDTSLFYNESSDVPRLTVPHDERQSDVAFLGNSIQDVRRYARIFVSDVHTVHLYTNKILTKIPEEMVETIGDTNVTLFDLWAMLHNDNFKRAVFHHVLRLSDKMREHHVEISEKLGLKAPGLASENRRLTSLFGRIRRRRRPYIAVHARLGGGVGETSIRFEGILSQKKTAANCLASRAMRLSYMSGEPPLPIFLATDTPDFREIFEQVVRTASHGRVDVVYGNWSVIHLKHLMELDELPDGAKKDDGRLKLLGTRIDLLLLGHAEHIVSLYSTFPRLALWLGSAHTLTELRNDVCLEEDGW